MFQHDMQIPHNVQVFKLIVGANLSEDDGKLVLLLANDRKF